MLLLSEENLYILVVASNSDCSQGMGESHCQIFRQKSKLISTGNSKALGSAVFSPTKKYDSSKVPR